MKITGHHLLIIAMVGMMCFLVLGPGVCEQPVATIASAKAVAPGAITDNEQHYNADYWKWQAPLNVFGGKLKGDILRHFMPSEASSALEFGCAGGYIIGGLPVESRFGVEVNLHSRTHAQETHKGLTVYERTEEIPESMTFDLIFTTSVLEHVDCPICSLRELYPHLSGEKGRMVVGVKNEGAAPDQKAWRSGDVNKHIYTWNLLILGNLITQAGFKLCAIVEHQTSWAATSVDLYERDKRAYCRSTIEQGKISKEKYMWAIAVSANWDCGGAKKALDDVVACTHV